MDKDNIINARHRFKTAKLNDNTEKQPKADKARKREEESSSHQAAVDRIEALANRLHKRAKANSTTGGTRSPNPWIWDV